MQNNISSCTGDASVILENVLVVAVLLQSVHRKYDFGNIFAKVQKHRTEMSSWGSCLKSYQLCVTTCLESFLEVDFGSFWNFRE